MGSEMCIRDRNRRTLKNGFSRILGRIACEGNEQSLSECNMDVDQNVGMCHHREDTKSATILCDIGGLDGFHKNTKTWGFPFLRKDSNYEYFCQEDFSTLEATVFCRMMAWSLGYGRQIESNKTMDVKYSTKCQGKMNSPPI